MDINLVTTKPGWTPFKIGNGRAYRKINFHSGEHDHCMHRFQRLESGALECSKCGDLMAFQQAQINHITADTETQDKWAADVERRLGFVEWIEIAFFSLLPWPISWIFVARRR